MKRIAFLAASVLIAGLILSGPAVAGTLVVGATPVPHSELLELVRGDLAEKGVDLKIVEFTDYVRPNMALDEGSLDANFFQHLPYLEGFARDHRLDLVSAGSIHVEPLGLYSGKHGSLNELPDGAVIAIPSDSVNGGRALLLLQSEGLISLSDSAGLEATEFDVEDNPKNLRFRPIESAQLPRVLPDVDGAVINGNYAMEAGLKPTEDALLLEGADSPYANIVAVRADDADREDVKSLVEALQSDKVRDFILENYGGGVVPAFGPGK